MIHHTTDGTFLFLGKSFHVRTIKPVPIASTEVPSIVPGNVPNFYNNKYKCTQENTGTVLPILTMTTVMSKSSVLIHWLKMTKK
jgi:hypothetical protein